MSTHRDILQAQIDDLKAKIGILEEHKKVDVKDMVDMLNQIRELKLYGKSVYEAIQMLSEDYMNKSSGGVALYNGVLSKLDKYDFVSQATTQPPKQEKWIVHRTLRKQNEETYVGYRTYADYDYVKCGYTMVYQKEYAQRYDEKEAIEVRDELNERRVGRRYLWVISKVEE